MNPLPNDGRIRPWVVLGQCPGCLRLVRDGESWMRESMPGATVGVYYHWRCGLARIRLRGRPH